MERKEVYKLINGERKYQDDKWNEYTTACKGQHSPAEWFTFIMDYAQEAQHILSRESDKVGFKKAMCNMRKVAAMAVCAMEQISTMSREEETDLKRR